MSRRKLGRNSVQRERGAPWELIDCDACKRQIAGMHDLHVSRIHVRDGVMNLCDACWRECCTAFYTDMQTYRSWVDKALGPEATASRRRKGRG